MTGDLIKGLACGALPPGATILHTCRLQGRGADLYGADQVLEHLRAFPLAPTKVLEAGPLIAAIDPVGASGLALELSSGGVSRIWTFGDEPCGADTTPRVAVPRDPRLARHRSGARFEAQDFPNLRADHHAALADLLTWPPMEGGRQLVATPLRAASQPDGLMAVLRLDGEADGPQPQPVGAFGFAACHLGVVTRLADQAGLRASLSRGWRVRL